jgi:amino acid adenylation domain-containing protein/FkbM family methyltransferase
MTFTIKNKNMDKKVIHSVFEEIVNKYPSKVAIETEEVKITYNDLNIYANRISYLLKSVGCEAGMIVNVIGASSIELVGAMLAVFKRGGIYLPVDPEFSEKRLKQIFENTFDGIVIVTANAHNSVIALANKLAVKINHLIVVGGSDDIKLYSCKKDKLTHTRFNEKAGWKKNPDLEVNGDSSNYIFYTSGSTGEGKAILGAHAGLSHFIHWEIKEFDIDDSFRVSQLTQLTFDASLRDIFVALISGGTLCIPPVDIKTNPKQLLNWLEESKINLVHCVPSFFRLLIKELKMDEHIGYDFSNLRYILMAGELIYAKDIMNWRKLMGDQIKLVNLYGATETTLVKTFYRIEGISENPSQIIPVGKPISNTVIAIVNDGHICKAGETGEIYIKTPFATKGYYKNEKLTSECFVQNPLQNNTKEIVYKTGDLGRFLPDGNIEILSRLDSQIKMNGIRIELTEVEQAMIACESITAAVVKAHKSEDNMVSLIGYYTGVKMDAEQFRTELGKELNQQTIPSYFIHLDEFPLNINGKIDKKALPLPEDAIMGDAGFESPIGDLENTLAEFWKEILGLKKIGRNISFFSVGGQSVRAIQLASRIQKELGITLKIADIFMQRTIQGLAKVISGKLTNEFKQIKPQQEKEHYPVSSSQKRLWILSQFEEGNIAYNMARAYVFEGDLKPAVLEYSFNTLLERHENLRTVFKEDEQGEIRQFINSAMDSGFRITYQDLRAEEKQEKKLKELVRSEFIKPFDLSNGPLLRVNLFRIEDNKWIFTYAMHHIISDGWSMEILIKELLLLYNARTKGELNPLPPLRIQYKDYASWQQEQLSETTLKEQKNYWLKQFEGELPALELLGDKDRPDVKTYNGAIVKKNINAKVSKEIKLLSQESGSTLFMSLLAAVNALLYRYTNQEDIIIGSVVTGREHIDLEDQIGFYVNTLALRTRFKGKDTYKELAENVKRVTLDAYDHQSYPFDEMVDALHVQRDMSRHPLFDVMVDLQSTKINNTDKHQSLCDIKTNRYDSGDSVVSKFDLTFHFVEIGEEIQVKMEYNSDIYSKTNIVQLADHLEQLLEAIIEEPSTSIQQLDYLSRKEKHQLLVEFNDTAAEYQDDKTIIELFEEQVSKTPEDVALVFGDIEVTYKELNEKSNQLANYLRTNYFIKPDDLIGIMLDRSEKMIISILSVLKAGGAYVPIDADYPEARKKYIIENTGIKVLITQTDYIFNLEYYNEAVFAIDVQLDTIDISAESPGVRTCPDDLAYVIYTSGSTGLPKGCAITGGNVANYIQWANSYYFKEFCKPKFGLYTSLSFDLTVTSIFCPLTQGGKLVIYNQSQELSEILHHSFSKESLIDSIKLTPSHINVLKHLPIESSRMLRAIVGGEEVTPQQVSILKNINPAIEIYNEYGPTETTVGCIVKQLEENAAILIGKPISKAIIYILDEEHALCPIGVSGEIYIGGSGLGKGYLYNPELTEERFIANPFKTGERIYKTGDLGRWLADGNIAFMGRKDDQVKIRGYRIESGEISSTLLNYDGIKEAAVLAKRNEQGYNELVAYYVPDEEIGYTIHRIIEHKKKALPPGAELHELPNELSIYAYNKTELQFLYEEIFRDQCYLKHGITIPENACIVDVGANIGMFSVFANMQNKGIKIYSFEPLPPVFELLKLNTSLYNGDFNVFNIGISDKAETADFTYFPNATVLSSRYSEGEDITDTVRKTIHNKERIHEKEITEQEVDELLKERLITRHYECKLKTLSQVIEENGIEKIDFLKIDVEKSELDVLNGISDKDWKKIKQIVIEIHDIRGRMEEIKRILSARGFRIYINQSPYLDNTTLYDVYAISEEYLDNPEYKTERVAIENKQWRGISTLRNNIENFLKTRLPSYMLPNYYVQLERLPLTPNGKLDKKALPIPENMDLLSRVTYLSPRNKIEEKLVMIWQEVLGREKIGVKDNFFKIGGDSLKAIRLASHIHKEFEVTVELKDLFAKPVLEEQTQLIGRSENILFSNILPLATQPSYSLSFSQRRFWILSQFKESSIVYNIPGGYLFEGNLDYAALEYSFNTLIERHEILRTVFKEDKPGEIRQFINSTSDTGFKIEYQDLRNEKEQEQKVRDLVQFDFARSFDLARGPLLRATLYQIEENKWMFSYVMHHIISDGWSMGVLIKELLLLYNAFINGEANPLVPLRIQYKDYAAWQEEQLRGERLKVHKEYWLKQFEGELPVLDFPGDKIRPAVKTYNGKVTSKIINKELTGKLKNLSQEAGGTLFMGLLGVVNLLLYRYTKQKDIIIGSSIAEREHIDLENQIGLYINTLALRIRFNVEDNFKQLLENVKQITLGAYEHQLYPFDELVDELTLQRDRSRSVLFDVMVVLRNMDINKNEIAGRNLGNVKVSNYKDGGHVISKFDLTFNFIEIGEGLQLDMEYNSDIYHEKTIKKLGEQIENSISCITKDPEMKIFDINKSLDKIEKEIQKQHLQKMRVKNLVSLKNKN